jgi:hypothetical protein
VTGLNAPPEPASDDVSSSLSGLEDVVSDASVSRLSVDFSASGRGERGSGAREFSGPNPAAGSCKDFVERRLVAVWSDIMTTSASIKHDVTYE